MAKISTGVRFDPDVYEAVKSYAEDTKYTTSHIVNELVRDKLEAMNLLKYPPLIDPCNEIENRQARDE